MVKHLKLYSELLDILKESSKDTRLKVGAILLKDKRIVATGYNGQVSGQPHEPIIVHGHDISTIHGEQNILCFCAKHGISTDGCEIVITHSPCQVCTKMLIQAGIVKIWYKNKYKYEENPFFDLIEHEQIE